MGSASAAGVAAAVGGKVGAGVDNGDCPAGDPIDVVGALVSGVAPHPVTSAATTIGTTRSFMHVIVKAATAAPLRQSRPRRSALAQNAPTAYGTTTSCVAQNVATASGE